MMPSNPSVVPTILIQEISSSLQQKVWRLGGRGNADLRGLVYLSDGRAHVTRGDDLLALEAPALFWLERAEGQRFVADAGTTGFVAEIAEEIVTRAVGDFSESAQLRFMVDRDHGFSLDRKHNEAIATGLGAILEELDVTQSGSEMLIVAHLRIILVSMMRLAGPEQVQHGTAGASTRYLQRFRQLVEGNFRAHWPISRYAGLIGISHDRLHAICRRELQKTPKALVAERLAREAGLGLERSMMTIEQLSHALGFRDPAHFSHFFKRMTGMSPGAFRRTMAQVAHGTDVSPANFADWP